MAERRMFNKSIVTSDAFLEMPPTAKCLYFTLNMYADDDGFVNSPRMIMRMIGSTEDDMKILIAKKFVLIFEDGILVIKHWRIHNYIQKDRYVPTKYQEHMKALKYDENKAYTTNEKNTYGVCIQNVSKMDTQDRLGKDSIGKDNNCVLTNTIASSVETDNAIDSTPKDVKHKFGTFKNVLLTDKQYDKLLTDYPNGEQAIEYLSEYIEYKGYKAKNHYLAIRKWVFDAIKKDEISKRKLEEEERSQNGKSTGNQFLQLLAEEEETI